MAVHRHNGDAPEAALRLAAIVPLGGSAIPAPLSRALETCQWAVAVRPPVEELLEASLVVFAGRDALIADALAGLRANARTALVPVLALVDGTARSPWLDPTWRAAADEALDQDSEVGAIVATLERLRRLADAAAQIPEESIARSEGERRRIRALRWMATRELAWITPTAACGSADLFRWGPLDAILGEHAAAELESLEKAGLLRKEHADRVYRCRCGDARLHFRDACEFCRSTCLETAHTLRHRACGHTGSSSDFWKGEELVCPACDIPLQSAGVDYDGPNDEVRCADCRKLARAGMTLATCMECGAAHDAAKLPATAVHRYALTEQGRVALLALPGTANEAGDETRRAELLDAWKKLAVPANPAAGARGKNARSATLVRYTSAAASGEVLETILDSALRASDRAVRVGGNSFLALLVDTPEEGARRFVDRMAQAERAHHGPGVLPLAPATQIFRWPEDAARIEEAVKALAPAAADSARAAAPEGG